MADHNDAIGILDSGVGGLTVFRRIAARLPRESVVYLGDTARVPYGTKSPETVLRYARNCTRVLLDRGVKLLVVACNTASAHALEALRDELDVPVLGVVEPGARAAVAKSTSGRIGVIGTPSTVGSRVYEDTIAGLNPDARVFSVPCPLFVPLAEEGWVRGEVPLKVAHAYLDGLIEHEIDALVLGCTHYPLLAPVIGEAMGPAVALVDSAGETAAVVEQTLAALDLACSVPMEPRHRFLVSDAPDGFARVGRRFLGAPLTTVEWLDF